MSQDDFLCQVQWGHQSYQQRKEKKYPGDLYRNILCVKFENDTTDHPWDFPHLLNCGDTGPKLLHGTMYLRPTTVLRRAVEKPTLLQGNG